MQWQTANMEIRVSIRVLEAWPPIAHYAALHEIHAEREHGSRAHHQLKGLEQKGHKSKFSEFHFFVVLQS